MQECSLAVPPHEGSGRARVCPLSVSVHQAADGSFVITSELGARASSNLVLFQIVLALGALGIPLGLWVGFVSVFCIERPWELGGWRWQAGLACSRRPLVALRSVCVRALLASVSFMRNLGRVSAAVRSPGPLFWGCPHQTVPTSLFGCVFLCDLVLVVLEARSPDPSCSAWCSLCPPPALT